MDFALYLMGLVSKSFTNTKNNGKKNPFFILSSCGFHAAPRMVFGIISISLTFFAFTCPKNPQNSQIISAHLKLSPSSLNRPLSQFGQLHCFLTISSPNFPRICFMKKDMSIIFDNMFFNYQYISSDCLN